jgi:pentapeptide repeat protein
MIGLTKGEMWQIGRDAHGEGAPDGLFMLRRVTEGRSMANEEHLTQLKQGVKAWNQWRDENRKIQPNLRGAHLFFANFIGLNLSGANLTYGSTWQGVESRTSVPGATP